MANTTKEKLIVCFPYCFFDNSIKTKDNIYKIVSGPAYKDMTPRHLKGIGNYNDEKDEIFNYISDQFILYFSQPAKNKKQFDEWHKNLCEEICKRFSALPDIELKFGKAQKLVNITFKHLYCFSDADSKAGHFKHCHIPIDSNVIDWCAKNAGIVPPPTAWSFMEYRDYQKFEESLYKWLNSDANTCYRDIDGTPYSSLQLDFIAWISIPETRRGILDAWRKIKNRREIWDKYKETVLTVFPELKEEPEIQNDYKKGEVVMENNKSKKEIIIEWAQEKARQGEIEYDVAFNGEKFVRYRTKKMTELTGDGVYGDKIKSVINPWDVYTYFYEIDLQLKTLLRVQLVLGYKHNREKANMIYERCLKKYKNDPRKADPYYNWVYSFSTKINDGISEAELKNKMDEIFEMIKNYEASISK